MGQYVWQIFVLAITLTICLCGMRIDKVNRSDGLDRQTTLALKGIAIFVIITHHMVQHAPEAVLLIPFRGVGYLGSAIFLFLSGYGLSEQYMMCKRKGIGEYFKNRIIDFLIPICITAPSIRLLEWCYAGRVGPVLKSIWDGIIGHWFLQMIFVWYIIFGCSLLLLKRNRDRCIALWTCAILIYILFAVNAVFKTYCDTIFCFSLGVSFSVCYKKCHRWLERHGWSISVLGIGITLLFMYLNIQKTDNLSIMIRTTSSITFLISVMAMIQGIEFRKCKLAIFLGKISFAIFLCHEIMMLHTTKTVIGMLQYYVTCVAFGMLYTVINKGIKKVIP